MRSVLLCVAACGQVVGGAVLADTPRLTASSGVSLPTPRLEALSCDDIRALMHQFSESDYRQPGEVPSDGADAELFAYENALAERHYSTCQPGPDDFASPSDTFGRGFN